MSRILAYDVGTTGIKTCLFKIDDRIRMLDAESEGYDLYILENGGAEQDADQWWAAMACTTKKLIEKSGTDPKEIAGISFCSQMQGLVLVDEEGRALRRPMSYMDQRGGDQLKKGLGGGLQVAGANAVKLLKNLKITKAAPLSVKDPVWKYKWVEENEPEIFKKVHKWLDVKEYLIGRCTGRFVMTEDSAYATMLYDSRPGHEGWSGELVKMFGVNPDHLPEIIRCTDQVGGLTEAAAAELGLSPGTPVFGGGGDATLIGIGSGCTEVGQTHIYTGTSGWVSTITDKQVVDVNSMIAAIVGLERGKFNYFAEMETAGKCLEWVKDHLALDEIQIYLKKEDVAHSKESEYTNLYDYMTETVKRVLPGSGGVLFTPWLHGNRCPFEDPAAAGMFFNIRIETGKTEMIAAVLEGVCYHLRWMLECEDRKVKTSQTIRFSGGGALSPVTSQILADCTGRTIEVPEDPQNVGSVGAAAAAAVGLGIIPGVSGIGDFISVKAAYQPDPENKKLYDRYFDVFKRLYKSNRENFRDLDGILKEAGK